MVLSWWKARNFVVGIPSTNPSDAACRNARCHFFKLFYNMIVTDYHVTDYIKTTFKTESTC